MKPLMPLALLGLLSVLHTSAARSERFSAARASVPVSPSLEQLLEDAGCRKEIAPEQTLDRFEAAALLEDCWQLQGSAHEAVRRLLSELSHELIQLRRDRVNQLSASVESLEATAFSPTTRLKGVTTFIIGGNAFSGSSDTLNNDLRSSFGGSIVGYDEKLILRTSFTGKDLLNLRLRAGDLDSDRNAFGGGGPSQLSELEVAFQQGLVADRLGVNRAWYQFPVGENWTFTVGSRVNQSVMLAMWPSVYPDDTVLDLFTQAGASGAYSSNLGAGGGVMWERGPLSFSLNYIAGNGENGFSGSGMIGVDAGSSATAQVGYAAETWGIAAALATIQNGFNIIDYASPFTLRSFNQPGITTGTALSGYWQPDRNGWVPSISAGWGWNSTRYRQSVNSDGLVSISQSWTVALQWSDWLWEDTSMGMAVGQPIFATALKGGATPDDAGYAMEGWMMVQISDAISVTPALFYLSRPLGADTPQGTSLSQLGVFMKTTLRF